MKMFRIAAAGVLALAASACLLTPGKFDASLDLRRDGTFRYRYAGEIVFVSPAAAAEAEADAPFDPASQKCFRESGDLDEEPKERPCSREEIDQARSEWEANRAATAERRKTEREQMKALFGGLDPSDPKAVDQFVERLRGYDGWQRVTHKGKGVFDVVYDKSGRIDHDYVFPVVPELDWIIPFVHVARRLDGRVRVVAPAFVQPQGLGGTFGGNALGMNPADQRSGQLSKPEGTFTLTTDAEILTNNTHDGPSPGGGGTRVLKWVVGPVDAKKPEALLKL